MTMPGPGTSAGETGIGARTFALPLDAQRPRLSLRANYGTLTLVPLIAGEEPRLEVKGSDLERLRINVRTEADLVAVEVEQEVELWWSARRGPWDVQFAVHVPIDVDANVRTNAGTIEVRRFDSPSAMPTLQLKSDAGRIVLEDVTGQLTLSTQAGEIHGRRISGSLDVETRAGRVDLEVLHLEAGQHRVSADVGSIRLALAPDQSVRVETRTTIGAVRHVYPSRADADAVLQVGTKVGSVLVEPLRAD